MRRRSHPLALIREQTASISADTAAPSRAALGLPGGAFWTPSEITTTIFLRLSGRSERY
jgi:hypothetical protein